MHYLLTEVKGYGKCAPAAARMRRPSWCRHGKAVPQEVPVEAEHCPDAEPFHDREAEGVDHGEVLIGIAEDNLKGSCFVHEVDTFDGGAIPGINFGKERRGSGVRPPVEPEA